MSTESTPQAPEWISTGDARRRLGVTENQLTALLKNGALTTRRYPGLRPKVLLSDVERLGREAIRPASARSAG